PGPRGAARCAGSDSDPPRRSGGDLALYAQGPGAHAVPTTGWRTELRLRHGLPAEYSGVGSSLKLSCNLDPHTIAAELVSMGRSPSKESLLKRRSMPQNRCYRTHRKGGAVTERARLEYAAALRERYQAADKRGRGQSLEADRGHRASVSRAAALSG